MRDTIVMVLTMLVTLFGKVPKIGPALTLLLMLVTQFWPELSELVKKLPAKTTAAVSKSAGTKVRIRGLLLRRCRAVASEEE